MLCKQICISNMFSLAPALGCPLVNGHAEPRCLCDSPNFSYGIRDCANEACGTVDANPVLAFIVKFCAGIFPPSLPVSSSG